MAQRFIPLYITDDDRVPSLLKASGSVNTFAASGNTNQTFGGFLGLDKGFHVDITDTSSSTYPLAVTLPNTGDFASADIDVQIVYRQMVLSPSFAYPVGVIVRATQASASGAIIGYGLFAGGTSSTYRNIQLVQLGGSGITSQTYTTIGTVQANYVGSRTTPQDVYRVLRLKIAGTTLTGYSHWIGDAADSTGYSQTSSAITAAGGVGFLVARGGMVGIESISIANGTDTPLVTAPLYEINGTVYRPVNPRTMSTTDPASNFPVRSYHRGSGTFTGSTTTGTDGRYRVSGIEGGQVPAVINAIDNVDDGEEWGHAIAGPIAPTASS